MTSLNLIVSQMPHLPVPTHWELQLQYINLEGRQSIGGDVLTSCPLVEPWQGLKKCCKKDQMGRDLRTLVLQLRGH